MLAIVRVVLVVLSVRVSAIAVAVAVAVVLMTERIDVFQGSIVVGIVRLRLGRRGHG